MIAVDRRTGRQLWKTVRPTARGACTTPIVFEPRGGARQLIVLGTIHLDAYSLETGERRWWMPVGSVGAMGTVVAIKDGGTITSLDATTGGLLKEGRGPDASACTSHLRSPRTTRSTSRTPRKRLPS